MKSQTADLDPNIAAVMAEWRSGRSLPQGFYGDPDLFRRDVDRVLTRHWLCAGHESQAASSGDYFLFDLAAESVIILRGADGVLRAFANVCRHRGSRVCSERSGNAKFLVCPYHAWTYGLDGSLQAARAAIRAASFSTLAAGCSSACSFEYSGCAGAQW